MSGLGGRVVSTLGLTSRIYVVHPVVWVVLTYRIHEFQYCLLKQVVRILQPGGKLTHEGGKFMSGNVCIVCGYRLVRFRMICVLKP